MEEQIQHLLRRTDALATRLDQLAHIASQVTTLLATIDNQEAQPDRVLYISVDNQGDLECTMDGESIILLTPEDAVKVASWCGASIQCDDPHLGKELEQPDN